jgi:hypothetical protein
MLAAAAGTPLDLDPLALLGERAAIAGFGWAGGRTSVGGAAHVVRAADGWVALNLPRAEDIDALPALLDGDVAVGDWPGTVAAISTRTVATLRAGADLLGLPLGVWPGRGARDGDDRRQGRAPFRIDGRVPRSPGARAPIADAPRVPAVRDRPPLVVDLTSLWAGPLATSVLGDVGARVIKVEGAGRADGARRGPAAFFDLMNHGKESVVLDLTGAADIELLHRLIGRADVVVEASRPRVMDRLGLDPAAVVRGGTTTWLAITGYGRAGTAANRVAFGDDAAFAAGCTVGDPPRFVADAVADPIAGLYGAAVLLAAIIGRRGNVVDLALVDAAAYACGSAAGTTGTEPSAAVARAAGAPSARAPFGPAPALGADTAAVRAEFA